MQRLPIADIKKASSKWAGSIITKTSNQIGGNQHDAYVNCNSTISIRVDALKLL